MSIYLTKHINHAARIEAFERRGLSGEVSVKAVEAGIFPISKGTLEGQIRYSRMAEELHARIHKVATFFLPTTKFQSILHRFDPPFIFDPPTLFVEMKAGGEILNAYGLFEAGTSCSPVHVYILSSIVSAAISIPV
jgi:hypothetical protein